MRHLFIIAAIITAFTAAALAKDKWDPEGRVVQLDGSPIDLLYVRSEWTSAYDAMTHGPGPIYFKDCVGFIYTDQRTTVTRIRFLIGAVDGGGALHRPVMPLDMLYRAGSSDPYKQFKICTPHGYANGDAGLWLVAWVGRVDFADGTSWAAPTGGALDAAIRDAIQ